MCVCRCIRTDLCVHVCIFMYLRAYAYARVCLCVRTRAVGDRQGRPLPFERRQRAGSPAFSPPACPRARGKISTLALPGPGSWGRQSSGLAAQPPPPPGSGGGFVSLRSCFGGLGAGGGVSLSAEVRQQACNHAGG